MFQHSHNLIIPPPPSNRTVKTRNKYNDGNSQESFINLNSDSTNQCNQNTEVKQNPPAQLPFDEPQITLAGDSASTSPTEQPSTPPEKLYYGDKGWSAYKKDTEAPINWADFDERHLLLGNEEDSSDKGHSSEGEDDSFDIWIITSEQKDYYLKQFKTMQSDLTGKISGTVAKEFFEKSNLPISELSRIWQLSDVDKDGALTLEEFCTAMHLVVLRRNNIELPDLLPDTLVPEFSALNTEFITNGKRSSPSGQENQTEQQDSIQLSPQNKVWTKFTDSPTAGRDNGNSPSTGMHPVNFDFNTASIVKDPKILHPVAVRLSPSGQAALHNLDTTDSGIRYVSLESQNQLIFIFHLNSF